ncbi:MAG TPA: hypothetical protein VM785_08525 [Gaiellales bacterium]|nr:hypothetical protein [Gaiellales bacterium]
MRYDELLSRTQTMLESGDLSPEALGRFLDLRAPRRRPDAAAILTALGIAVAYAGVAIAYAIGFEDMSRLAQELTPFAFPAVAIGASVVLAQTGRPLWQAEAAGLVGQVALAAAFVTLAGVLDPQNPAAFGTLCGLAATIEVLACHRLIGSVRLTGWGLSASVVALVSFGAASVGDRSSGDSPIGVSGMLLIEAGAAALLAAWLVAKRSDFAPHAARTASLLAYAAAVVGLLTDEYPRDLHAWHFVLALTAVFTFLAAAVLRMDALIWVGALGGLIWLGAISQVVGNSSGAAWMVVLAGVGLVGLGALVRTVRAIVSPA